MAQPKDEETPSQTTITIQHPPTPKPAPDTARQDVLGLLRGATTTDEKIVAFVSAIYVRVIDMLGEKAGVDTQVDAELQRKSMNHRLFRWGVNRLLAVVAFAVLVWGITALWRAGDRETVKLIITGLGGMVAGWGARSASERRE
ncbi:MAG: hypothetical protein JNK72_24790 [Myxococcales bacterium]|nr:hypothetical protein [Myxococcales bacterium]